MAPAAVSKPSTVAPVATAKPQQQQQPSDAIQKAMEATLASISLPAPVTSATAAAFSSPVVAVSDR